MSEKFDPWLALAAVCTAILILFYAFAAFAHDHERPELNDWFMHLKSKKSLCCDGNEAVHLKDVEWQTQDKKDSHYRAKVPATAEDYAKALKGEDVSTVWVDVPDDVLVDEPNKEGEPMVWPMYLQWDNPGVRCFMPGTLS